MQPTWELVKENVQPLKSGRSAERLESVLSGSLEGQRWSDGNSEAPRAGAPGRPRAALSSSSPNKVCNQRVTSIDETCSREVSRSLGSSHLESTHKFESGRSATTRAAPTIALDGSHAQSSAPATSSKTAIQATIDWWEERIARAVEEVPTDPLGVWIAYIRWRQEAFPSGGLRAQLSGLMDRALRSFVQAEASPLMERYVEQYRNDPRYVRLWVQYADMCPDPTEIFLYMRAQDVGQGLALFFEAFASVLEAKHQFAMADRCYAEGIERGAIPLSRLARRHEEFQARMIRRLERQQRTQNRSESQRSEYSSGREATRAQSIPQSGMRQQSQGEQADPLALGVRPALATIRDRSAPQRATQETNRRISGLERTSGQLRSSDLSTAREMTRGHFEENRPPMHRAHDRLSAQQHRSGFTVHAEDTVHSELLADASAAVLPVKPHESGFSASALRFPTMLEERHENRGRIQPWNQVRLPQDDETRVCRQRPLVGALSDPHRVRSLPFEVYVEEERDAREDQVPNSELARLPALENARNFSTCSPALPSLGSTEQRHSVVTDDHGVISCPRRPCSATAAGDQVEQPQSAGHGADALSKRPESLGLESRQTKLDTCQNEPPFQDNLPETPCSSSSSKSPGPMELGSAERQAHAVSPTVHTRLALADIESMFNSPMPFERETESTPETSSQRGALVRSATTRDAHLSGDQPDQATDAVSPSVLRKRVAKSPIGAQSSTSSDSSWSSVDEALSDKENCANRRTRSEAALLQPPQRPPDSAAAVLAERPQSPLKESDYIIVDECAEYEEGVQIESQADSGQCAGNTDTSTASGIAKALVGTVFPSVETPLRIAEEGCDSRTARVDGPAPAQELDSSSRMTMWTNGGRSVRAPQRAEKSPSICSETCSEVLPCHSVSQPEEAFASRGLSASPDHSNVLHSSGMSTACTRAATATANTGHDASSAERVRPSMEARLSPQPACSNGSGCSVSHRASADLTGDSLQHDALSECVQEESGSNKVAALEQEQRTLPALDASPAATRLFQKDSTPFTADLSSRFQPHLTTPERDAFWNEMEESTTSHASLLHPQDFVDESVSPNAWYLDIGADSPPAATLDASLTLTPATERHSALSSGPDRSPEPFETRHLAPVAKEHFRSVHPERTVDRDVQLGGEQLGSVGAHDDTQTASSQTPKRATSNDPTEQGSVTDHETTATLSALHRQRALDAPERATQTTEVAATARATPGTVSTSSGSATMRAGEASLNWDSWHIQLSSVAHSTPLSPIPEEYECGPDAGANAQPATPPESLSVSLLLQEEGVQGAPVATAAISRNKQAGTSVDVPQTSRPRAAIKSSSSSFACSPTPATGSCTDSPTRRPILRPFTPMLRQRLLGWLREQVHQCASGAFHTLETTPDLQEQGLCRVRSSGLEPTQDFWFVQSVLSVSSSSVCGSSDMNGSCGSIAEQATYYLVERSSTHDHRARRRCSQTPPARPKGTRPDHGYRSSRHSTRYDGARNSSSGNAIVSRRRTGPEVLKVQPAANALSEFVLLRRLWQRVQQQDSPIHARMVASLPRVQALYEATDTQTSYLFFRQLPSWGTLADLLSLVRVPGYIDRTRFQLLPSPTGRSHSRGLDPVFVAFVARELLRVLGWVHGQAILHWHVRPESIWLVPGLADDHQPCIVLADWQQALDLTLLAELEAVVQQPQSTYVCRGGWVPSPYRCPSMQQHQPWAFDVDLYAVACTLWSLLGHQRRPPVTSMHSPDKPNDSKISLRFGSADRSPTAWIEPVVSTLTACRPTSTMHSQKTCEELCENILDPFCNRYRQRIQDRARAYAWILDASRDRTVARSTLGTPSRSRRTSF
ncbi:hypothetical protein CCYA_CCYA10G2793 [Cyanidiococcus yangmingshanensis]|nr:hypothetical protein CCYA_CCYA10G2793 [Cyanidiococcus yangmingshanensis]